LQSKLDRLLFRGKDPTRKTIELEIGGQFRELEIVGIMEELPQERLKTDDFGFRTDRMVEAISKIKFMIGLDEQSTYWKRSQTAVHIPITLMPQPEKPDWIMLKTEPYRLAGIAVELQNLMVSVDKKPIIIHNLLFPMLIGNKLEVSDELTFALFLLCLAMGGIMVMNIMLVSVTERGREIAIRRAEGATRADIIALFMVEGTLLCLTGAIIGIPLGVFLARIVSYFDVYTISNAVVPVSQSLFAIGWSVLIGFISSIIPAVRAANLPPATALKHE